jgi:hypothetical protein
MKKIVSMLAVFALAGLTGCGGNVCSRSKDSAKNMAEKVKACTTIASHFTEPSEASIKQCEDNVSKCTADDTKKLNEFFDCVDKIGNCEAGKETEWTQKFQDCNFPTVSTECGSAF